MRIFGNLPYNISTKIIFYLLNYNQIIDDMHFMLQKDVADRLVSQPHKKTYGRLSIMAQSLSNIFLISESIPPNAFIPIPKVRSTVVRIIPKKNILNILDVNILNKITIEAFSKRRKMIRNSLKKFFSAEMLHQLNISENLRAENISVAEYCKLTNFLKK